MTGFFYTARIRVSCVFVPILSCARHMYQCAGCKKALDRLPAVETVMGAQEGSSRQVEAIWAEWTCQRCTGVN